jgi:predicted O-methyltransferase YrrM
MTKRRASLFLVASGAVAAIASLVLLVGAWSSDDADAAILVPATVLAAALLVGAAALIALEVAQAREAMTTLRLLRERTKHLQERTGELHRRLDAVGKATTTGLDTASRAHTDLAGSLRDTRDALELAAETVTAEVRETALLHRANLKAVIEEMLELVDAIEQIAPSQRREPIDASGGGPAPAGRGERGGSSLRDGFTPVESLLELSAILQPRVPLEHPGPADVDFDVLRFLVRHIAQHHPAHVVEAGAGLSTIVIGLALKREGKGHLTSFTSNETVYEDTLRQVGANQLDAFVDVVRAPLVRVEGTDAFAYEPLDGSAATPADLLVIDAAHRSFVGTNIGPIVEALAAPGATVVIGDILAGAESRAMDEWFGDGGAFALSWVDRAGRTAAVRLPA